MSDDGFSKSFEIRWADLDANGHLRNSAYSDYATHVRFAYLAARGFDQAAFREANLGPVILREETRFLREIRLGETIDVDIRLVALSNDGARFRLRHAIGRAGEPAAVNEVDGGWLDLARRRLVPPPSRLRTLLEGFPRGESVEVLPDLGDRGDA